MKRILATTVMLALAAALLPGGAAATNGMNLQGYGPVSAAMGGSGLAFENGTAAMMINPATMAFLPTGLRFDLALGNLGPDVDAIVTTPMGALTAESDADAFYMPAFGMMYRRDAWGIGLGVYSQGGMGTEYGPDTWLADPSMGANTALEAGLVNRSELSVGRVIVPGVYRVNERLSLGATLELVWAGLDLQMALSEAQFQDLANPMAQNIGTASGSLLGAFGALYEPFGGTGISRVHHAYFDFSNDSDLYGQARSIGVAGKIGAVFAVHEKLSIGATYHSPTALGDLETDEATLSMAVNVDPGVFEGAPTGTYMDMEIPVSGSITVVDFQWPAVYGIGAAFRPNDRFLLAADVRYIDWSGVMEDFTMTFTADNTPENGAFAGLEMDAVLFQKWEDQAVVSLGGAMRATDELTLRAGFNYGANPVPDDYLNALFPAIVESHVTFGGGWSFEEYGELNLSFVAALESDGTNPGNGSTIPPVESTHSQFNWMVMYSYGF